MKYHFILLVMLAIASAAHGQATYRPYPNNPTLPTAPTAATYSGFIVYGASEGSGLGLAAFKSSATPGTRNITWPTTTANPCTYIWGFSPGTTYSSSTFVPVSWHVCVPTSPTPTGPSPTGPYSGGPGSYVPVDGSGDPVDPETGVPLPPEFPTPYVADFDITNPLPNQHMTYLISVAFTAPPYGGDSERVTVGGGQTVHRHLEYWVPFIYNVRPYIDGHLAEPGDDGNTPGGTGEQPEDFVPPDGAPGGGTGAPTGGSGTPGGTAPPTPGSNGDPPPADTSDVQGNVQAEIQRLELIIQNAALDAKNGVNMTNAELSELNKKAAQAQAELAAIKANTATTATNTATGNGKLEDIKGLLGGLDGGGDGLTQAQLDESLRNDTPANEADTAEKTDSDGKTLTLEGHVAQVMGDLTTLKTSAGGIVDGLGLGASYGSTAWTWSINLGMFGTHTLDIEGQYGWLLDIIRNITLGLICMQFVGALLNRLRGALVG